MSDDPLLRALGRLAREQAQDEGPPVELTTPSREAQARATNMAMAALGIEPAPETSAVAPPPARTESLRTRWRRWWTFTLIAPVAAAATLVLVLRTPSGTLPAYTLEASGGVHELRGEAPAGEPLQLEDETPVELGLRPATHVEGEVDARLYLVKGPDVQRWEVTPQRAPGGAMRVVARVPRPFGAGVGEIVAIVGRPDRLPGTLAVADLQNAHAGWQILRWPVRWR